VILLQKWQFSSASAINFMIPEKSLLAHNVDNVRCREKMNSKKNQKSPYKDLMKDNITENNSETF
jgi:hypothetical protein